LGSSTQQWRAGKKTAYELATMRKLQGHFSKEIETYAAMIRSIKDVGTPQGGKRAGLHK